MRGGVVEYHRFKYPGARKPWHLLSSNQQRKIRKEYLDSLDARFNRSRNNSVRSTPIRSNEEHNLLVFDNSLTESATHNITCSSVSTSVNCDFVVDNSYSASSVDDTNIERYPQENRDSRMDECKELEKPINVSSASQTLKSNLAKWVVDYRINQVQSDALLNVLRLHPQLQFLPQDSRTLFKTLRDEIEVKIVIPGEYIHLGLEFMLQSVLSRAPLQSIPSELLIDFSTDRAAWIKKIQIWFIQFPVVNLKCNKPKLAGIYKRGSKPNSSSEFFSDFVKELNSITRKGGIKYKSLTIPIKLRCFVADAPVRAYILNHYGHNSLYPCSKCYLKGSLYNQYCRFAGINYKLRTNREYRSLSDVNHNKGKSALHDLPIDLVNQVSFDYVHLVCLGVMKKTIESLVFGECKPLKLRASTVKLLSNRLLTLQLYCPREFSCNPLGLDKFGHYKATDYRQLLLYTFIVVFRGIIADNQYNHFLLLHSSMRVLLNDMSSPENVNFAEKSLKTYIIEAEDIHGLQFLTYNTHGLLHLISDYKKFGSLNSVSALRYKNRMFCYQNSIGNPDRPLQEIFRSIHEKFQFPDNNVNKTKNWKAFGIHDCGPIPESVGDSLIQYEQLQTPRFFFSIHDNDNTIITRDGRIGVIKNIIHHCNEYQFVVHYFGKLEPFYTVSNEPSTKFGVFLCSSLNHAQAVITTYTEIESKCYRMPMWIDKGSVDFTANDEQMNNLYVIVTMSCSV